MTREIKSLAMISSEEEHGLCDKGFDTAQNLR